MKKQWNRVLAFVLLFALFLSLMPESDLSRLFVPAAHAEERDIPEAFSLEGSPLGAEKTSGLWHYALREDGYAVVTGYDGTERDLTVPDLLSGYYVVGIASGALTGRERVALPLSVYYLAEDAFGDSAPEIVAPNGSYGLCWADSHGLPYSTGRDYDLVPGVLDYTALPHWRVQKRGEEHVAFDPLSALPLSEGSLFLMRDTRGLDYFYRVTSLTEEDGLVVAQVVIPDEVSDVFINYRTTAEIDLTAADFVPADGVTVGRTAGENEVSASTLSKWSDEKVTPVYLKISGKTKGDMSWSGSAGVDIKEKITYTVNINEGIISEMTMSKSETNETFVKVECSAADKVFDNIKKARAIQEKKDKGEEITEEEYSFLDDFRISSNVGDTSIVPIPTALNDLEAYEKAMDSYEKALEAKSHIDKTGNLGYFHFQAPLFNLNIRCDFVFSLTGSLEYRFTNNTVTQQHYDDVAKEWVIDDTYSSVFSGDTEHTLTIQGKAKIAFQFEISLGIVFLNDLSAEFEIGIEVSVKKVIALNNRRFNNCTELAFVPYASFKAYTGVWVGKSIGFKYEIYTNKWTAQDLLGKPNLLKLHLNAALTPWIHQPEDCPLKDCLTIHYETRGGITVTDREIFPGGSLTAAYNPNLGEDPLTQTDDWTGGAFLGWAWNEQDTTPTAAPVGKAFRSPLDGSSPYVPIADCTVYDVWESTAVVSFNTGGGSTVESQKVPLGGHVRKPDNPVKDGSVFVSWQNEDGVDWNFDRDKVTGDMTLTAQWSGGDAQDENPGTLAPTYIGNYYDVSNACIYDPNHHGSSAASNFQYEERSVGESKAIYITGIKGSPEHLVIPAELPSLYDEHSTLPVIDISTSAFRNQTSLRSVYFLTDDDKQFTTTGMFSGCTNLEYVEAPALENGLVGSSMFSDCTKLKCVKLRSGCKVIGDDAFYNCTSLRSAEIPNGISSIGYYAFNYCSSLEDLYIPDTVKSILVAHSHSTYYYKESVFGPFIGCTALKQISIGGVDTITEGMLKTGSQALEKLTIRGTVKNIAFGAFDSAAPYSLKDGSGNGYDYKVSHPCELIIEEGVQTIEAYAFDTCTIFSYIQLPSSLSSIDYYAFRYCKGTADLTFEQMVKVGTCAFTGCTGIRSVVFGNRLNSIGSEAFNGCNALKTLDLGQSVQTIGAGAFANCSSLESIYVPDSVETLVIESNNGPFTGCTAVKELNVGGVKILECGALKCGSKALNKLTIRGTVNEIANSAFDSRYTYSTSSDTNSANANGYDYSISHPCELIIEDGVQTIGDYAFNNCKIFSSIHLPSSLTSIGSYAFYSCPGIADLSLDQMVTVESSAFSGCIGIRSLSFGNSLYSIESDAFKGCTALKALDLGQSVQSIGTGAFANCISLESIYIPDSVKRLKISDTSDNPYYGYYNGPFTGCTAVKKISVGGVETLERGALKLGSKALEKLIIRGTVKNIADFALDSAHSYNVSRIDSNGYDFTVSQPCELIIEDGVQTIGDYAFNNCKIFSSIQLPSSLTTIGECAFADCTGIAELSLDQIVSIGSAAFASCTAVRSISFGNNLNFIGPAAFYGCTALKALDLGQSVQTISVGAFADCSSLESIYIPDSVKTLEVSNSTYVFTGPFCGCTAVKELNVGGVETLECGALRLGSKSLEKLTIRGTVSEIASSALDSRYTFNTSSDSNILYANGYDYPVSQPCELIIEDGVQTIGDYAFYNCKIFSSIQLPASLTFIGIFAFANCSNVTDLLMHGEVNPFADNSLSGCSSLTVHLADENEAMATYCTAKNIPFDSVTAFSHTLTLVMNRTGDSDRTEEDVLWHSELTLPVPTWSGHVFSGWFSDEALTQRFTRTEMPAQDLTLYAAWDKDIYSLDLVLNGGTAATTSYRFSAGMPVTVNTPKRDGFYFTGWTTDVAGTASFDGLMPAEDTVLYAAWHAVSASGRYRQEGDHAILLAYQELEEEDSTVYLPETVNGLPLTKIAAEAFADSAVTHLYIPATVTDIAVGAFRGSQLRSLTVAEGNPVYHSSDSAIYSADGSELLFFPPVANYHLSLPASVTRIALYAFDGTQLRSIVLNEGLQEIGERAFRDAQLSRITLPESLQTIGERAFFGCRSLYCIEAKGSPETIGDSALSGCYSFLAVYGPLGDCPLRTAALAGGARYNAYVLTLNLPLRSLSYAQEAGTALTLPSAPEAGENLQFTGWFTDEAATQAFSGSLMPEGDLSLYAGTEPVFEYETLTDPDSGTVTGLRITGCNAHEAEPVLPDAIGGTPVVGIAAGAFGAQYTRVSLPSSLQEISSDAFAPGTILVCEPGSQTETAALAAGYSTEGRTWSLNWDSGFALRPESQRLSLGAAIQTPELTRSGYELLGWYYDTGFSEALNSDDTMPARELTLYARWAVTDEDLAHTADALLWTAEGDSVTITGFSGDEEDLTIPALLHGMPVNAIAEDAFAFHSGISSIVLPDSVTEIGAGAFRNMRDLTAITLPSALQQLPAEALANTALTELTVPAALQLIDPAALRGCDSLTAITVEEGNTFYEGRDGVLYDTAESTLFKYPAARPGSSYTVDAVWAVSPWAFEGAASLEVISFSSTPYFFGEGAFRGCSALTDLPAPISRLSRIPDECFYGCSALRISSLPENIQELGRFSLAGTGITELTVTASLTSMDPLALGSRVIMRGESGCYAQSWASANGRTFLPTDTVMVESISLSEREISLLRGERRSLEVTVTPAAADASSLSFFSTNEGVVKVDENGMIYAVGGGSASVYVTAPGGAEASCAVTVEVLPESFSILYSGRHACSVGDSFSLGAQLLPRKVTNPEILYTSGNPAVAEIAEDGTVTALKPGAALITATPSADPSMARSFLLLCGLPEPALLPAALTALEEESMSGSAFVYVRLPETLSSIGDRAFAENPALCLAEFSDPDTVLGEDLFLNCSEQLSILAPAGSSAEAYAAQHDIPFIPSDAIE